MSHSRFALGFTRNRKVFGLSDAAFRLYVSAIDWSREQRTDGILTEKDMPAVPRLPRSWRASAVELVGAGLWEATENGWRIIEWCEPEETKSVSSELSAKRAAAGRKGGLAAGETRRRVAIDAPEDVKTRARQLMKLAIARGELVRGPCAVCGNEFAEGHHHDYSKPLDVTWLCAVHHGKEHARLQAERRRLLEAEDRERSNLLEAKPSKVLTANAASADSNAQDPSSPLELPSPDSLSSPSDSGLLAASSLIPDPEPAESFSHVSAVKPKRRWRKVPAEWEPTEEHRALARERGVDFELELSRFRDHEFASPKSDANATFRNWLRNARPTRAPVTPLTPRGGGQNFARLTARIARLELEEAEREAH